MITMTTWSPLAGGATIANAISADLRTRLVARIATEQNSPASRTWLHHRTQTP